ncbi:hypothetical protein B0I73DRAFT_128182 [Yarrowia lipolytica]|uniref:Uncharacterized protein n=1 Tax=Yarrowia lipolytica TaxID=4952 RepID=A0A371C5V1_YARLL|nr:hypothetical protein B0I71DRAFT_132150 [Yarrowia lipolytica]RDW41724.1 hypothetical protein B0I73DRAFT_128182 [Yarrowia lipolytica]RDW46200.1 hypothetical protein B0I74DRAFT_137393 [Yarrowia lipolytica]RDW53543.1 hypothetical protein B0I75DRAFT_136307 [Yarrowia lipolytica]
MLSLYLFCCSVLLSLLLWLCIYRLKEERVAGNFVGVLLNVLLRMCGSNEHHAPTEILQMAVLLTKILVILSQYQVP